MNNSKKIVRIILFLILFIPSYFAIYNIYIISSDKFTVENTTKIEIVGTDGQICAEYTNGSDIKLYIKTLENAKHIDTASRQLDYEQPLVLTFYRGERKFVYGMYLSMYANDCIIKTSDGELLHMNENDAKRILNTDLSDTLYKNNKIPIADLYQGDEPVSIYPSGGEWKLKKPDGNFYLSSVPNMLKESANEARAFQNKLFDIRFDAEPDVLNIEVKDGKEIIFSDIYRNFTENFTCDSMKELQYILTAEWIQDENKDYCGKATYVIDVTYYVPAAFDISQTEAQPGDIVAITAYNMGADENLTLTADIGYETKFVSVGANRVALIPVGLDFAGKTFKLTLTSDVNEPVEYYLKVNEKPESSKNLGAQDAVVKQHLSDSARASKQETYNAVFAVSSGDNEKYWTDKFAMPKEGKLWLEYGWNITVNMGYPFVNNGINIDIDPGNPVKASNTGKVIFAGEIPDDGKLVVIDHGMGIKTWYAHLGEIDVKEGDGVLKGQQIGAMNGRTGLYTDIGYNLYFAVSVKNIFVNPVSVINNGIPGTDAIISTGSAVPEDTDIPEAAEENTGDGG